MGSGVSEATDGRQQAERMCGTLLYLLDLLAGELPSHNKQLRSDSQAPGTYQISHQITGFTMELLASRDQALMCHRRQQSSLFITRSVPGTATTNRCNC